MPRMVTLSVISSNETSCRLEAEGMFGVTEMDFPISVEVLKKGIEAWDNGAYVQDAFSTLDADHREFLMTGMLPEQFDEVCGDD